VPQISELASQGIPAYRTDYSRGNQWHLVNIAIGRTPAGIEATGIAQPARLSAGSVFNPISLVVLKARTLTLEQIAKYPIITHDPSFSGRWRVMDAFKKRGLAPDFMFGIVDADVSKAYVERDLGIAILPSMAIDSKRDVNLRARDIGHLFPPSTIYVTLRKIGYLPRYVFDFIQALSPALTADVVQAAVNSRKAARSAGGRQLPEELAG